MTNLAHLLKAEACLTDRGLPTLAHAVQDAREELQTLRTVVGNRQELRFVDATPDADLPRRILEAHLDESETVSSPPELGEMMNQWRIERNAILRAALAKL